MDSRPPSSSACATATGCSWPGRARPTSCARWPRSRRYRPSSHDRAPADGCAGRDRTRRATGAGRGWRGFIAPIPNCTTTGLAVSLKPLHDAFGVRAVTMTSLQAVSGAGRQGGVLALDVIDNVIPFIPGEEEKVERETRKILGHWDEPAPFAVSCTCTRVNVKDGHLEAVFVGTELPADAAAATAAMNAFGVDGLKGLPSAPDRLLVVDPDPFRPQPRRDRDAGDGMTVTVGRR